MAFFSIYQQVSLKIKTKQKIISFDLKSDLKNNLRRIFLFEKCICLKTFYLCYIISNKNSQSNQIEKSFFCL